MIQQVKLVSISSFPWVVAACKLYRPHETLEDNCRQSAVKTLSPPFKIRARERGRTEEMERGSRKGREKIGKHGS